MQIPLVLDLIRAYNIPVIIVDGWEADDVIATLATRAAAAGMDVRMVTNDKDARQLISPKIKVYSIRKKRFYDEADLLEESGASGRIRSLTFSRWSATASTTCPAFRRSGQDSHDAPAGVRTLEEVLANADKVKGKKVAENLKTYADKAYMSRELVRLNRELPIELDWETARLQEPNWEKLLELFTDYGFRRYSADAQTKVNETKIQSSKDIPRDWKTIHTLGEFEAFLADLKSQSRFVLDLETTGLDPLEAEIVGWAFCWQAGIGYYIGRWPARDAHAQGDRGSGGAQAGHRRPLEDDSQPKHQVRLPSAAVSWS